MKVRASSLSFPPHRLIPNKLRYRILAITTDNKICSVADLLYGVAGGYFSMGDIVEFVIVCFVTEYGLEVSQEFARGA